MDDGAPTGGSSPAPRATVRAQVLARQGVGGRAVLEDLDSRCTLRRGAVRESELPGKRNCQAGVDLRRSFCRRIRHQIANRGPGGFLRELLRRLRAGSLSPHPGIDPQARMHRPHPFDVQHGVDTTGLIWGERLVPGGAATDWAHYWATGYYGIAPSAFAVLLAELDQPGFAWSRFTFVDAGCGKGRALLLALRYPFRRIAGVELSPELAVVAEANLRRFSAPWRLQVPADVVTGDAATVALPDGPLIVYLYHPFAAPVMRRFLDNLNDSLRRQPREIYLIYVNPELDGLIRALTPLIRLWELRPAMTEEDREADLFEAGEEHALCYHFCPAGAGLSRGAGRPGDG